MRLSLIERLARVEFEHSKTLVISWDPLRESTHSSAISACNFMMMAVRWRSASPWGCLQHRGLGAEAVVGVLDSCYPIARHACLPSAIPGIGRRCDCFGASDAPEAHYHKSLRFKDEWADDVVFAVLASEWVDRPGIGGHAD